MPEYQGKVSNFGLFEGSTEWYVPGWGCENCDMATLLASRLQNHSPAELPYNFIIIEEFFDRWMIGIQKTREIGGFDYSFNGSIMDSGRITDYAINYHLRGKKGVIFTVPRYQDLPYMNWYSMKDFQNAYITFNRNGEADGLVNVSKPFSLIPTAKLHTLCERFKGGAFMANFEDIEVIDYGETYESDPALFYNTKIREYAAEKDLAVVDLFDLYQRIHRGGYTTDDGVPIDGTAHGNFFSSDGIYPLPLGQAIIANEIIKAINKHYGAKIPLIDTAGFAKSNEVRN